MPDKIQLIVEAINKTKSTFKDLHADISGLRKGFLAFAADIATVAAPLIALGAVIRSVANEGENLLKISKEIGIPIEKIAGLKYAAELSESSIESLTQGVGILAKNMQDAASGSGEAQRMFKTLGIEFRDVNGNLRPVYDVLMDVSDRFSKLKDDTGKTAFAMKLFGRSGKDLIPFLNEGSAATEKLIEESKKLGNEWTGSTAKAADDFNDSITRLTAAVKGLGKILAQDTIPSLTRTIELVNSFFTGDRGKYAEAALAEIDNRIEKLQKKILDGASRLKPVLETLKKQRQALLDDNPKLKEDKAEEEESTPKVADEKALTEQRTAIDASLKITLQGLKTSESLRIESIKTEEKMLEEKYKNGLISEEEYIKEKNNLEAQVLQTSITFSETEQKALTNAWNKKENLFGEEKDKIKELGDYKVAIAILDEEIARKNQERNRLIIEGKINLLELSKKEAQAKRDGELKLLEAELNLRKQLNAIKVEKGDMTALEAKKQELNIESELTRVRIEKLQADKADASSERKLAIDYEILALEKDMLAIEEQLKETRTQMSGTFTGGMERGFKQWLSEAKTTFQQGVEMARATAQAMESTFEDFFFDALQGKMKSLRDYFVSFAESIQRAIAKALAQQATASMISGIASMFAGGASGSTNQGVDSSGYGAAAATRHQGGYIPRFHVAGLASDERFAINKVGERYITKEQNEWLTRLGNNMNSEGQNVNVVVNVENKTGKDMDAEKGDVKFDGENYIIGVVFKNIDNNGVLRQSIQGIR